jgi:hypothetical protein
MLKFRLQKGKGSVSEFVDAKGNRFKPGDIVDLPPSYRGEKWLEVIKPAKIPEPMVEVSAAELNPDGAHDEKPKARKQKRSK